MIALTTTEVVTMPTWLFLTLLGGLIAWNVWLMWANNTTRDDLRRERYRRQVHEHLHHDGPDPQQLRLTAALGIPEQRQSGGQS